VNAVSLRTECDVNANFSRTLRSRALSSSSKLSAGKTLGLRPAAAERLEDRRGVTCDLDPVLYQPVLRI